MIERRPVITIICHLVLLLGVAIIAFPIWITFVASTHDAVRMVQVPLPLLPGDQFFINLKATLSKGTYRHRNTAGWYHDVQQFNHGDDDRRWENRHFTVIRVCHRLFSLPFPHGVFLDDFHHPHVAG